MRAALLFAAAFLMIFGALGNAFVIVPDLHGDLIEIGVRPTVLGGTVLALHFGVLAECAFAAIVLTTAIQAMQGAAPPRVPLAIIAATYAAFGIMAFSRSHNPHHLGPLLMGVLIAAAILVPHRR